MKKIVLFVLTALLVASCGKKQEVQLIDAANFNKMVDGKQVSLYTLQNAKLTMQVTNYGARVVALWAPDRKGNYGDVTLGYDHIDKYLNNTGERYLGAVVGRCANRIAGGAITLDGETYQLPKNDGENTLHGGEIGTDRVVWDVVNTTENSIVFHTVLPDGQDGFPGNLDITMTYTLTDDNAFQIDYEATTDKTTLCNLSHHSFFNLQGEGHSVLDQELEINGCWILPVDQTLIPLGDFRSVKDTPFDFMERHAIGEHINDADIQLSNGQGYDHTWIITSNLSGDLVHCATLFDPTSGRKMEVLSDQMGMQFYSGNFFDGKAQGKWGAHVHRGAVALETQKFPDAIHQDNFSDKAVLNPGETYKHTCVYKFTTAKK